MVPSTTSGIARVRLEQTLLDGAKRKLVLIKAPTGYGKTTLAAAWARQLINEGATVAWLTLDADDNEPSVLASHIASAFEKASPDLVRDAVSFAKASSLAPARNLVSLIANAACDTDEEIYLFLDEFQAISDPACHDHISQLLRYTLSNFHVVLISRAEPRLSVSKLRLEEQYAEIVTSDLLFDARETAQFLGTELAQKLGRRGIWRLVKATEGWPAAIQLARIALRKASDPVTQIRGLSGASPNIAEYLEDTVKSLEPPLVDFLIKTSVLQQMNGAMCDAVTGRTDGPAMLDSLRREQFMLETIGGAPDWLRYHRLMRDHLLSRLRATQGDIAPVLYRRAHDWCVANGLFRDAADYAIQAGDHPAAVEAVKACGMDLIARSELATLLSWARHLPEELVREQFEVAIALAWGMALVTRFKEARAYLDLAEHALPADRGDDLWRVRAARAVLSMLKDDIRAGSEIASECLKHARFDDFTTSALGNVVLYHRLRSGALPLDDGTMAMDDAGRAAALPVAFRHCLLGVGAMKRLQLHEAGEHLSRAQAVAKDHFGANSVVAAMVDGLVTQHLNECGHHAQAELMAIDHLELIETTSFHESFLQTFRSLSRAAASRGDTRTAFSLLNRAERLAWDRGWKRVVAALITERLKISLGAGDLVGAAGLKPSLDQLQAGSHDADSGVVCNTAYADGLLALADGEADSAVKLLQRARDLHIALGDELSSLYVGIDLARAHMRAGSRATATDLLCDIIAKAESSGCQACLSSIDTELRSLTRGEEQADELGLPSEPTTADPSDRPILTIREQSIIAFIASGRSNKEIARELGVGPETIKTQLKRIFHKLSAETRTQAVVRAQYLGLLGVHQQASQMRH